MIVKFLNKLIIQLKCSHDYRMEMSDFQHHLYEGVSKTKVRCNKCGKTEKYEFVI